MGVVQIYLASKTSSGMVKTTIIYYLLDPLDDLVLGGVAGQPLVKVGDDVDAEVAHRDLLRGWGEGLALTTNCT